MDSREKELNAFFERISEKNKTVKGLHTATRGINRYNLSPEFGSIITGDILRKIYRYLLEHQEEITDELITHDAMRLPKETTGLERTVSIISLPIDGSIALIYDPKSKVIDGGETSYIDIPTFSGTFKTTKAAFRLDSEEVEKWANAVCYATEDAALDSLEMEVKICQAVAKDAGSRAIYINAVSLGAEILDADNEPKKGMRNKQPYLAKRSVYSLYAQGDLANVSKTDQLSDQDKIDVMSSLLLGIQLMHERAVVHQDLKFENLLFYRMKNGRCYCAISDFGFAYNLHTKEGRSTPEAGARYVSPEIVERYKNPKDIHHDYFFNARGYATEIYEKASYTGIDLNTPDKANDMWAVGIILFRLYHSKFPTMEDMKGIKKSTVLVDRIIAGCLEPDRNKRLTITDPLVTEFLMRSAGLQAGAAVESEDKTTKTQRPRKR